MSQENVNLVIRMFESFSPLRTEELQSILEEFIDPDIDWRAVEGAVDDVGGMRGTEPHSPLHGGLAGHVR
jgi:hypothetical protein